MPKTSPVPAPGPAAEGEKWTEYIPLDEIIPADRNPKAHDLPGIRSALRKFGYVGHGSVDERTGKLVIGHGRRLALLEMHADGEDPPKHVRVLADGRWAMPIDRGWASDSDDVADALIIADNQWTIAGGWNHRELTDMLGDLAEVDLHEVAGFTAEDIDAMIADLGDLGADEDPVDGLTDPDAAPDPPADPISAEGDVWQLGPHRLVVGDATDVGCYDLLLGEERVDMVWTDPPYGVAYVGKTKDALTIENDALDPDRLREFLRESLGAAFTSCRPGGAWYVTAPPGYLSYEFGTVLKELKVWRHTLTWVKDQFVLGRSDYHYRHESIFYGWKEGAAHTWNGGRTQDSILEIPRPKRNAHHPTMKPVELVRRCLENSSNPGAIILDPFGGSGTTLLAAHATRRVARLVELDPRYADVICRRWQEHTGILPIRAESQEAVDFTTADHEAA